MRGNGGNISLVMDGNTIIKVLESRGCMITYSWACPRCSNNNIFTLFSAPSSTLNLSCSQCGLEVELRK